MSYFYDLRIAGIIAWMQCRSSMEARQRVVFIQVFMGFNSSHVVPSR
jgi:hypothetical protein